VLRRSSVAISKRSSRSSTRRWSGIRGWLRSWEGRRRCIGATRATASWSETWTRPSPRIDTDYSEVRDLGERLLAIGRIRTRGRASGAETESPFCYLGEFKNGKVIRVRTYLDPEEALEAAGLRE
jgi:ketosteroid isomerase-like protein